MAVSSYSFAPTLSALRLIEAQVLTIRAAAVSSADECNPALDPGSLFDLMSDIGERVAAVYCQLDRLSMAA